MSNIRLFYPESLSKNLSGKLNKDQSKYLNSVMRLKINDNFSLDPMPTRWGYAVFGDVIDGFSVVDDIASNATQTAKGFQDVPVAPIIILEVNRID